MLRPCSYHPDDLVMRRQLYGRCQFRTGPAQSRNSFMHLELKMFTFLAQVLRMLVLRSSSSFNVGPDGRVREANWFVPGIRFTHTQVLDSGQHSSSSVAQVEVGRVR